MAPRARRGSCALTLLLASATGCEATGDGAGIGGAGPTDPTVTTEGEACCPDPSMLGYSTDFECFDEGLVCPWLWMDTGAVGGGVVRCGGERWGPWEDCADPDFPAECPAEGADLGACDLGTSGGCVCVCRNGSGVCVQSADCVAGRWVALAPATDDGAWCAPYGPVTVTAWADGSCTAERTCVRDDHLVDCTPIDDGASCECGGRGSKVRPALRGDGRFEPTRALWASGVASADERSRTCGCAAPAGGLHRLECPVSSDR